MRCQLFMHFCNNYPKSPDKLVVFKISFLDASASVPLLIFSFYFHFGFYGGTRATPTETGAGTGERFKIRMS